MYQQLRDCKYVFNMIMLALLAQSSQPDFAVCRLVNFLIERFIQSWNLPMYERMYVCSMYDVRFIFMIVYDICMMYVCMCT